MWTISKNSIYKNIGLLTFPTFSHLSALFWETSPCADVTASLWGSLQKLTSIQSSIYNISCLSWYIFLLISLSLHLIKCYWSLGQYWHNFLTSITKVKTQTKFMVLFTSGSSLTWGNLQVPSMVFPQVFICYLPLTINFSCFYRHSTMTESAFFDGKEERWGEKMRAIWGDLSICPCLDSLKLLCHTQGELLSISHLKIWGDTQEPHNNMAYLLVHTEGDSEAQSYGMALVWISPH